MQDYPVFGGGGITSQRLYEFAMFNPSSHPEPHVLFLKLHLEYMVSV